MEFSFFKESKLLNTSSDNFCLLICLSLSKISYPSGEVVWNMGLPSEYMASGDEHICTDLLFSFQHNIQF